MYGNKHLEQIGQKFIKVIKSNFGAEFGADVTVRTIDSSYNNNNNMFSVESNGYILNCVTNLSMDGLNIDDKIRLKGILKPDRVNLGSVYVFVDFLCRISDYVRLEESIKIYGKVRQKLSDPTDIPLRKKINMIRRRKMPRMIKNIGLITFEDHKFVSDTFKIQFQEKW